MKAKMFLVLILATMWSISNGQRLYPPIQPYQENDYSLEQVKKFAMASTKLSSSWRKEMLAIVNNALLQAKEDMTLTESHVAWVIDHVVYERRKLTKFENSRNVLEEVKFYDDQNYDGMVGTFKYGKCKLVLYKSRCINLLKFPVEIVQTTPEPKPEPAKIVAPPPPPRDDWSFVPAKTTETKPALTFTKVKKEKTWFGRKWPWFVGTAIASGVTSYLLLNQHQPAVVTTIEPRTMPPGVPSTTPTSPGVPSDPRTMPGGTGMTFGAGFSFRF